MEQRDCQKEIEEKKREALWKEKPFLRPPEGSVEAKAPVVIKDPTWVDAVFGGELQWSTTCQSCKTVSRVSEPFYDMSLPIPTQLKVLFSTGLRNVHHQVQWASQLYRFWRSFVTTKL